MNLLRLSAILFRMALAYILNHCNRHSSQVNMATRLFVRQTKAKCNPHTAVFLITYTQMPAGRNP